MQALADCNLVPQSVITISDPDFVRKQITDIFLFAVKARRPTPGVSPSPFPDDDSVTSQVASAMGLPATRNQQAALKFECLKRDNYRCMATGWVDPNDPRPASEMRTHTQLVHIVPFCLGTWDNATEVGQFPV